jgi:hypothetical protein
MKRVLVEWGVKVDIHKTNKANQKRRKCANLVKITTNIKKRILSMNAGQKNSKTFHWAHRVPQIQFEWNSRVMEDEKSPFTVVFGCHPPVTIHTENGDQDGDGDNWPVTVTLEPESTVHLPVCATTSTSDGGDSDVDGGSFDVAAVAAADEAGKKYLFTFLLTHFLPSKLCRTYFYVK